MWINNSLVQSVPSSLAAALGRCFLQNIFLLPRLAASALIRLLLVIWYQNGSLIAWIVNYNRAIDVGPTNDVLTGNSMILRLTTLALCLWAWHLLFILKGLMTRTVGTTSMMNNFGRTISMPWFISVQITVIVQSPHRWIWYLLKLLLLLLSRVLWLIDCRELGRILIQCF